MSTEKKYQTAPPHRRSYRHVKCGMVTTMGHQAASELGRPSRATNLFCIRCQMLCPSEEFLWDATGESVVS